MDIVSLGRKINSARKALGITSEALAEKCSINPTYLRQIESGVKTPSLPLFVTLCQELNASPHYLLSADINIDAPCSPERLINLMDSLPPDKAESVIKLFEGFAEIFIY